MIFKTLCKLYTSGRSQHKYTIYIQYIHTITYTIEYFRKDVSSKRVQIENRITRQFFDFQNLRELGKTEQRIFEFFFFSKIEPFIFYHILEKPAFVSASLPHKMSKLEVAKDTDDFDHFSSPRILQNSSKRKENVDALISSFSWFKPYIFNDILENSKAARIVATQNDTQFSIFV